MKWDPKNNVEEEVIGTLVVTPASPSYDNGYIMDVTLNSCVVETWIPGSIDFPQTQTLDWRSPSFFRRLGKIMKCACPKK